MDNISAKQFAARRWAYIGSAVIGTATLLIVLYQYSSLLMSVGFAIFVASLVGFWNTSCVWPIAYWYGHNKGYTEGEDAGYSEAIAAIEESTPHLLPPTE